jgi:NADH dehydrogenase
MKIEGVLDMAEGLVTVFGGSGFLGRYLVRRLARKGLRIRVAVRHPNLALFLKPVGDVGQIQIVQANLRNRASLDAAVAGADAVVNLVGILFESGAQKFMKIQAEGPGMVAEAAAGAGVKRLVQISAIGADADGASLYARSKAAGEKAATEAYPEVTIIRPGLLFGPEDNFLNRFAALARLSPVMPLICGATKFQPVFAGDVADAIVAVLDDPSTRRKTFELGGPRVMTFKALLDYIQSEIQTRRPYIPIPAFAAKIKAFFLQWLPTPPLTIDQVRLLEEDNVAAKDAPGFKALGLTPTPLEAVAPAYLARFRPHGQFSSSQSA